MHKMRLSEKVIPVLFDVVVYGGFAAFLFASYITFRTLVERFPEPAHKIIGMLQNFLA
ncbi:hypothetical protein [Maridesulfovibrio ferrireducens]|uniref:Uncharacterized protein n=1 Tax=Maridesulfovibrio ferrireducens TaxID=246191 RepID=A0A1G9G2U8_9BACT|nr:hypothetical protein [Maridesulfovibrio ferrireducens]MBI9109817.1 hypothetical protein [Maridesulfovibrio ferrireducens]SDK94971.1 hypothetical protein SAMN05660337_1810 [Maridesulfovibrio ferrireducens]